MNGEQNSATETPTSFLDRLRECTTGEQVVLYRAGGRELEFIDRYSAASIAASTEADIMADVKAEHGGGSYELRLLRSNGQIGGRHTFSIAGLPKRPTEEKPAANNGGELAAVLASIQQSNQQTQQLLLVGLDKIAQAVAAPKADPFDMFERVAGVMGKFGGTPKPERSLLEQFGELEGLMNFADRLKGGGAGGGLPWQELIAAIPATLETVKAMAPPAPAARPGPGATESAPTGAGLEAFRPFVATLLTLAAQNADPEQVAGLAIQQTPDPERLVAFARRPDAVDLLAAVDSKVSSYRDWFVRVAHELGSYEFSDDDGNDAGQAPAAGAGSGGGPAHPALHGGAGAPGA